MIDPGDITAARRALGRQLAKFRRAKGYNQHQLASHAHYGRSSIANVEVGRQNVPRDFWLRCDQLLEANGTLLRGYDQLQALIGRQRRETAEVLSMPTAGMGDDFSGSLTGLLGRQLTTGIPLLSGLFTADDEERLSRVIEQPRRADSATIEYFWRLLEAHTRTDPGLMPADLIAAMTPAYAVLGRFRRDAPAPVRQRLHALASRYAQLIGRMHYEAGNLAEANYWSDLALLAAHEAGGDEQLVAYTLARRASLAGARGDTGQVVDLATAARKRVTLPPHIDAMARRHEAQGHAMAGDVDMCIRRLNEAAELLVHGSNGEEPPYASGFSLGFHDVQAAGCYIELGRSTQAAEILERELPRFRADYVKAYNLARLAHAYASMRERERAAEVARSALALARQTGAGRALQALRGVHGDLTVWWD